MTTKLNIPEDIIKTMEYYELVIKENITEDGILRYGIYEKGNFWSIPGWVTDIDVLIDEILEFEKEQDLDEEEEGYQEVTDEWRSEHDAWEPDEQEVREGWL